MNFSTSIKDSKDYVEHVDIFHHNSLTDETFAKYILNIVIFIRTSWQISLTPLELPCCFMDPTDLTYEKMISKLGSVVGDSSSLFNLTISEDENVHYHLDIMNRLCTSFRFGSLEENQFRCLFFILGLRSPCHAEIRLRLPSLLDKETRCQEISSQTRICWRTVNREYSN
ncbi:unnamed protein product [Hymenolepis diminuta]|uniref:Uncharacterized protein n=1 Tax=Hymenolepis diminuta TaxID=6216 RepID=A0A564YAD9_HYMDI|nr:unnamed protein product [Hymenolepis diminuta]